MRGLVESVFTEPVGSDVVADSTGTTVTVDEGAVFVNATQVQIADVEYGLLSVDGDELTLDDSVTVEVGEQVFVFPFLPERLALVSVDDGETVSARVPHALSALLADGDRVDVDREVVVLGSDDAGYFVSDVLTRNPQIEASLLVGELPPGMGTTPADVEPSYSPIPVARGGLGLILVSWEPVVNASPVVYDVYMGASSGFTADSSSLLQSTAASMVSVRALPDGTVLSYDTDYFFKLVARSGVLAAAESVEVAGRMDQAGSADIVAGSVTAEKLASTIVLAGEIATASAGARVELSSSKGIESFRPDGSLIAHFPVIPNGEGNYVASLDADAVLRSATVQDRLSIRGQKNEIGKGAILSLTTGTTAPQSSPSVAVGWVTKNTGWLSNRGYNPRSWFYDSGYWYTTESLFGGNWKRYTETSTEVVRDKVVSLPSDESPIGGIVVISGKAYVLVQDRKRLNGYFARWYVYRYDVASGAKESEWEYKPYGSDPVELKGYWPTIGVKGSNLIIAQAYKSDNLVDIWEYTTTGSAVGSRIDTNVTAKTLYGLMYGSFDFGSNRYILLADDTTGTRYNHFKVLNTSGVEQTNDVFPAPTNADGIGWDSSLSVFKSSSAEVIYRHTNISWSGSATRTQWVAHSWFDSNVGGTGQHETFISEPTSFSMNKRANFTVTFPPLPAADPAAPLDSVTGVRAYHNVTSSTKPTAGAMWRESVDIDAGLVVKRYETLTSTTLYANTGTPTGFPASTPAVIQSSDSPATILLQGDGEATLNKVVSLKDEALGLDLINSAGTGVLQTPVDVTDLSGVVTLTDSATSTEWLNAAGTGTLQTWNTVPQVRAANGSVLMTPPSGGGVVTTAVTFPTGRFTSGPWVGVTARTSATAFQWVAIAGSATTSGVTISLYRTNNTTTGVDWIAIET